MNSTRVADLLKTAERAVLLLAVGGVPLFILFGYTLDAVNLPKVALLVALVSLATTLRLLIYAISGDAPMIRPLALPAVLLLVPLTTSWLFSDAREWSLFGAYLRYQGLIPYLLVAALGFLLLDAFRGASFPVAIAVAAAASGVAAYGLLQRFGADPLIWGSSEMGSTLGNSNFTAQFLAMSIPVLLGMWHGHPRSRLLLKYALPLIALAWVLTRSEGGLLAGIAGICVFYGCLATRPRLRLTLFGAAASAAAIGITAILGSVTLPIPEGQLISLKDRGWHWQSSANLIAEDPLLGHGPNGFALKAFEERPKAEGLAIPISLYVDDAYSVPLSYGVSAGIFGLIGFIAFFLWWLARCRRFGGFASSRMRAGWLAAVAAYFVQSLFTLDELSSRVLLWTCLAGIAIRATGGSVERARGWAPRAVAVVLALLLLPAGLWQANRMVRADHLARSGRLAAESFDYSAAAELYGEASNVRETYWYGLQEATSLGRAALVQGPGGQDLMVAMKRRFSTLQRGSRVTALFQEAGVAAAYAPVDAEWGHYAAELYREALELDPWNIDLAINRARVLTTIERYEESEATLQPFVAESPKRADFWCRLAQAQRRSGDVQAAQVSLGRAFELDPSGAASLYRRGSLQIGPAEPPCS